MPFIDVEGEIPTGLDSFQTYQAYNILDSAVTAQLLPAIKAQMNENHLKAYRENLRVMTLCLELSTKGFPIDQGPLAELLWQLEKDEKRALRRLHQFCDAVESRAINPRSTTDVPWFFYEHLGLPKIYEYDRKTKTRKVTSDIKALEKLRDQYPIAIPFVNAILAVRESSKMASVFKRGLEPQRSVLRCSFSATGTVTGRLSSQQNPYGRGTNAQNLTDRVRQAVAAPDGYAILNLDLKTAESIAVGYISGCRAYIDACLTGDVHTAGCRLVFPDLQWTGEIEADKNVAEQPFYRWFTYRDLMKKGGHATNYYGKPRTLQLVAFSGQVTVQFVEMFQEKYFEGFPEIEQWHLDTIAKIQQDGIIVTPVGRERRFWGRPDDPETHRKAIAYAPQSLIGHVMNEGLVRGQEWALKNIPIRNQYVADIRAQVHDSGLFLVPLDMLADVAVELIKVMTVPVDFGPLGEMIVPFDLMVGRRWNKAPKKGADKYMREGLTPWKPGQPLHWL